MFRNAFFILFFALAWGTQAEMWISEKSGMAHSAEVQAGTSDASPQAGEKIFAQKKCSNCHAVAGPEKIIPVTERPKIKGPSLWYAGSKYQPGYLASWLAQPRPFRGVRYGTMMKGKTPHPTLSPDDAVQVAVYLESLRDSEMPGLR